MTLTHIFDAIKLIWPGLSVTLTLSALSTVLMIVGATIISVSSISQSRFLRGMAATYIGVLRSIPVLALLVFAYFGVGHYAAQLSVSAFTIAVAVIAAISAAYLADIYRGAILSVPRGQWEAGSTLGLSRRKTTWYVVIPQVVPALIPATLNLVIGVIKITSLASLITVPELTLAATSAVSLAFRPMDAYVALAVLYLAIIAPLVLASNHVERRLARPSFTPAGPRGVNGESDITDAEIHAIAEGAR